MATDNSQKRIRTSFKHEQLGLMKAYFKVNQNPDSKELKQLSVQTDLPKRVLQVSSSSSGRVSTVSPMVLKAQQMTFNVCQKQSRILIT